MMDYNKEKIKSLIKAKEKELELLKEIEAKINEAGQDKT